MEKKIIKKLLAVMMIITILATDFFVLGSSLKTYATQVTNEIEGYPNIHFSTYFKEGGNEVKEINKSIKDNKIKLYAKIGVNNDVDYLKDVKLNLKSENFSIISSNKGTVEKNTVSLDYIGSGSMTEIELDIEPILSDKISSNMILKPNIELNAKYIYADKPEGEKIQATSETSVKYQPDETTKSELETDIITNKILAVNGTNKRIIQVLLKSRLSNNEYPVKQTIINVNVPNLSEIIPEVSTLVIGKLATNGKTEINSIKIENENAQITINNEIDDNNQVSWKKDAYDEIVLTYIYPETVDASKVEITANSEIKLHGSGNTYTSKYTKGIENKEPNNVIMGRTEITTDEMYKGYLYANIDANYNTKTSIIITNADVAEEIVLHEGSDIFGTSESELIPNTKYITTTINKENMLSILGQDGNIQIKNGETINFINKESKTDSNGNIIINYENSSSELEIETSNPVNAGVLEINHVKALAGNTYTREQLKNVKTLKVIGSITGNITENKEKQNVVSGLTITNKSIIALKETSSKAELTVNRTTFSATETNEVVIGIKLITNSTKYDLYKNPSFTIKFPETIENVEFMDEPDKLYADEFTITNKDYDIANHKMTINMIGEQKEYPESEVTQAYIQLKLKITFSEYVISQTDKIIMQYKNDNTAEQGSVEQTIKISAPSELVKMFDISVNSNKSLTEKILHQVKTEDAGKEINFNIELVNNKETDINNVRIVGKLPTTGNTAVEESTNTLETILKSVNASNATIYYTENANATSDIDETINGWTTSLLLNAKLYMIKLDKIERGAKYTATTTIQIPNEITENALSYSQYEVIYDAEGDTNLKESSRKIGLVSSSAASIKVETKAQVGQEILNNRDFVKEGEVIKYTVTVKNSGVETLENIKLKLNIPDGTVYVTPMQRYIFGEGTEEETVIEEGGYVYAEGMYYEEITDTETLAKLTDITISNLSATEPYIIEYEVRVNKGTAGSDISNKSVVTYNGSVIETEEINNTVKEANIRVTVKRAIDISEQLYANGFAEYVVIVENLSESVIKDLEMKVIANGFTPETISTVSEYEGTSNTIKINKLESKNKNGTVSFTINGKIDKNVEEMNISAIISDSQGEKYRSNIVTEKLPNINVTVNITSPQNGAYIKEGDTVEYNITVKNIGDCESIVKVTDTIPEYINIEEIYVNKELKEQSSETTTISNDINYPIYLKPQEQAEINIKTKVGYIADLYHGKAISNTVRIIASETVEANSQTITHILKSSENNEQNIENIISGLAWFDKDANGRKDADEDTLEGISVKLYDALEKHYITDENGNPVETITDVKGEYTFTGVPSGSYLIVFEYDTSKYEFTTKTAQGVDTSLNSKVEIKNIETNDAIIRVAAIEVNDLNGNIFDMNIGLKENTGKTPSEQQPGITEKNDNNNPDNPIDSEEPGNTENPEQKNLKNISGLAWLDINRNGQKDSDEKLLSEIKIKLYDVTTQSYLAETITNENGRYEFSNLEKGSYVVIFEYNTEEYEPTTYMAEGVETTRNSKAVLNNVNINGQQIIVAVTDIIYLQDNITNINIGLKEKIIFDLELNKYISKIIVQTNRQKMEYEYNDSTFEKVEIHRKQISGSIVVFEYTIKIKNNGEVAGYAKNIVDYLPSGLTFSSELNKDWYLSGNNLYTKSLENVELRPGEEKEVKLTLTKTMTNDNVGLINNRAEIYQDYNKYGEKDIDSTPNNQVQNEDDFGSVDVIILVATGGNNIIFIILLMINIILIGFAIKLMIKTRIIKRPTKKVRR